MHHYCTYFDSRYLARGLALLESLGRHARPFVLHALCLDEAAYRVLDGLQAPELHPIALAELEQADPELLTAKGNRNLVEYYFTLTPALPRHVLLTWPEAEDITYLDADLFLFADPEPLFAELAAAQGSVLIIEHRYPAALKHLEQFGRFNVGWLTFRNDAAGRACLDDYRRQCLEWCYERLEPGRYADQKYLDAWPQRHAGVVVAQHPGANLAPWNLLRHALTRRGSSVRVEGRALLFYHFHRLKIVRPYLFDPGLEHYGAVGRKSGVRAGTVRRIYGPYLRALRRWRRVAGGAAGNLRLGGPGGLREVARLLLYGRPLVSVGPVTAGIHLEPVARPLLRAREWWKRRVLHRAGC